MMGPISRVRLVRSMDSRPRRPMYRGSVFELESLEVVVVVLLVSLLLRRMDQRGRSAKSAMRV